MRLELGHDVAFRERHAGRHLVLQHTHDERVALLLLEVAAVDLFLDAPDTLADELNLRGKCSKFTSRRKARQTVHGTLLMKASEPTNCWRRGWGMWETRVQSHAGIASFC